MSSDPNYQLEDLLDIYDSDLPLTSALCPRNRQVRETITITSTQHTNVIVQVRETPICKQSDIHEGGDDSVLSTQEYMKQVVEDVGKDEDFNSGLWVGVTDDLKVTIKDLSGTLTGSIHYKVINEEGYGKEIIIGSAIILTNVSIFFPNASMHYLNITKKHVVKVFHKVFVPGNGSGVEDLYKFDKEALDLVLKEETKESKAHEEWLEKSEDGGALGANKAITHPVISIFMYPFEAMKAACALEVDAMGALYLVEVEAVGALDLVEVRAVGSS
nr:hypothetical protein [Tanacetum cinerariifolium]